MYEALYLEINVVSSLLLIIILLKHRTDNDRQAASLAYGRVLIATLCVIALDIAWVRLEGIPGRFSIALNYIVNILYLSLTAVISYLWLQFVLCRLYTGFLRRRFAHLLLVLPLTLLALACVASPWTHWLFEITAENTYQRGPYLVMQQIVCYGYMAAACAYTLSCALREKNHEKRSEALTLSSFVILPAIGGILNILVFGLPTTWPLTVVSLLIVYLNLQGQQISTDELTGLNNRRQFDRYLLAQTEDLRRDDRLYLLLIDINAFKKINDTYGHQTGDAALVQTARLLKQVCGVWDCFLARYGGDEFAIVFRAYDSNRLTQLKDDLLSAFARFNASQAEPYELTISIGVNASVTENVTPAQLIAQADAALYAAKAERAQKA